MSIPIGLHATNQRSADLFKVIEQLQPTVVLMLDGLGEAVHIHEKLNVPYVFHRVYNGQEGSLWNNRLSAYKTPSSWIDEWRGQGHPEIARVVLNEPHANSEEELGRLFDYLMDVGDRAAAAGFKASLGGFATANTIRESWLWSDPARANWHIVTVYDRFLRWAADWTAAGHGYVDWHNYSTFPPVDGNGDATALLDPARCQKSAWKTRQQVLETHWRDNWLFYRDVWLAKRCEVLGVSMHQVVYGEGWADAMPNLASIYSQLEGQLPGLKVEGPFSMGLFYASRFPGHTQAEVMRWVDEWIIDTMPAYAVGLCFFAWNWNAPWGNNRDAGERMYNIGERPDVLSEMYKLKQGASVPEITLLPDNDPRWKEAHVTKTAEGGTNIRSAASTNGSVLSKLNVSDSIFIVTDEDQSVSANTYRWYQVRIGGVRGWVADTPVFEWAMGAAVTLPAPTVLLDVPHRTQRRTGLNNCGPAVVAMIVGYWAAKTNRTQYANVTVEEADSATPEFQDGLTVPAHLKTGAAHYGLALNIKNNITLAQIKAELDARRPVIALVERGRIPGAQAFYAFAGPHYVVISGYGDGYLVIHDPLSEVAGAGDGLNVRDADWDAAHKETTGNSANYQGLFMDVKALEIPVPEPEPDPVPERTITLRVVAAKDDAEADLLLEDIRALLQAAIRIGGRMARIEIEPTAPIQTVVAEAVPLIAESRSSNIMQNTVEALN